MPSFSDKGKIVVIEGVGQRGPAGPAGANGTNGTNGATGPQGPAGPAGPAAADPPYIFRPKNYSAAPDGKMLADVVTAVGSPIATSASGGFAGAVAGQYIYLAAAGGFPNVPLVTTIASVQSANQVTLAVNSPGIGLGGAIFGTDVTAGIQACIDAATSYGQVHGGATILFDEGIHVVAGAIGGTNMNAQLRLPDIAPASSKVHLVLQGPRPAQAFQHWLEASPPHDGAVIFSMYYNDTGTPVSPQPAVISGPSAAHGGAGGLFSNLRVVVDGINILVAHRPCINGLDLYGVGQADIKSLSYFSCATPPAVSPSVWPAFTGGGSNPSPWQTFGYRTPTLGNNAQNDAGRITVYSAYHGVVFSDHFAAMHISAIACASALTSQAGGHHAFIGSLMAELCNTAILSDGTGSQPLTVSSLHMEDGAHIVDDGSNYLQGEIRFEKLAMPYPYSALNFIGAANLRIVNDAATLGLVASPPAVPASATAQFNGYGKDAIVVVSGGTVSQISVNGVNQGVTSGPIFLPPNSSITITYTVAPTWTWTLH